MVAFSPAFSFHGQVNFAGNWGANVIGRYSPYIKYLPRYFDQPLIKEPCIRPSLTPDSLKGYWVSPVKMIPKLPGITRHSTYYSTTEKVLYRMVQDDG